MSSPATPRSTRSASPDCNMLTPGQKIKAMMAEFDSDSESDTQNSRANRPISKLDFNDHRSKTQKRPTTEPDWDSDDADAITRPQGRMAARMQGGEDNADQTKSTQDSAFSRLSRALRTERQQPQKLQAASTAPEEETSDDELPASINRRRRYAEPIESPASEQRSQVSPARARSLSPLFVSSPSKSRRYEEESSDETIEISNKGNARFLALVAQKRKEREEREKLEMEQKAAKRAQMEQFSSEILSGEESEADDKDSGKKLSQKARQPRKASKKAMEEMHRETQRMSRNMQLAHQAQTKKKITKESLFARFNFMQPDAPATEPAQVNSSSTAGSQPSSDGEGPPKIKATPQTSPVQGPSDTGKPATLPQAADLPSLDELIGPAQNDLKEPEDFDETTRPTSVGGVAPAAKSKKQPLELTRPPVRVLLSRQDIAQHQREDSDSDDLEVVTSPAKCRRIAAFENLPAKNLQESASMIKLKALAHLTSPTRKMTSMNSAELSASLLYRARQQASKERKERLDELRARGMVIETAEERAAMEDDVENLMEKARQEAQEIARQERAAKKKAQGLDQIDDEEDDYEFSGSDDDDAVASGEEEEENDDDDDCSVGANQGYIEQEADDGDESSDVQSEYAQSDAEDQLPGRRWKRTTRVVSDDEEDEENQVPSTPVRPPSNASQSVERPRFPGIGSPEMTMGLTQAFAGTLADAGTASQLGSTTAPFSMPDPGRPVPMLRAEESEILVRDSQEPHQGYDFLARNSDTVARVSESPATHFVSQYSQLPDPTQDEGFVFSPFDPAKRFRETPPMSTVDTVLVSHNQSPIVERRNRQLRRGRAAEPPIVEGDSESESEINTNAFDLMKKSAKKPVVPYDKKSSKAKDIVDEAAEESEDEYAGLGGASDDSDGEEDAYDQEMINDNSGETVDEKQLAALNAVHQRNRDEKDVAKLLKDITTGALRRRRGVDDDFDLDDSDDERLARRREKQREFAKMRRALLADDKVGELAENPKKAAFFKAIEDRDEEDDFELEFMEEQEGNSQNESSESVDAAEQDDSVQNSKKRKRPLEPTGEDATNRPPPHLRRTAASAMSKKPATLAEIRETLSFLTETPEYDSFHEDASLDEEGGGGIEGDDYNTSGAEDISSDDVSGPVQDTFSVPSHPRRTRAPVVDRLALLRQASSNSASATASGSAGTKLAFHGGSSNDGPIGFRPPQLLRRVNTGSSSSSSSSSTSNASNRVAKSVPSGPKKGGAVNSYAAAREQERERQLRMKQRGSGSSITKLLNKHAGGGLGALAGKGQWD